MNDNEYITGVILEQFNSGSPVVLVSIVSLQESSPRHSGTKMVVTADGKSYGTIGGSVLEATAIKEAVSVLANGQSKFMNFDLIGSNAYTNTMICGGKVVVLLDYLPAIPENVEFLKYLHDAIRHGKDYYCLTTIQDNNGAVKVTGRSLLSADGTVQADYGWPKSNFDKLLSEIHNIHTTSILSLENTQVIVEPVRKIKTVYSFGAGHVAKPTAHLAAMVGFHVVVVDDRAEFANEERFPDSLETRVIDDFNHAVEGLKIDADSFIIILTRNHMYDRAVLEQVLNTDAGYIGMISSRRKRDAIFAVLLEAGVKKEALERVHAPIGLSIKAETPEEIAISIVAELILERARQRV